MQMKTEHVEREKSPWSSICLTQGRTKASEFYMAAREDLCFRMENLHKTSKGPSGATAGSKDCPRNQVMRTREGIGLPAPQQAIRVQGFLLSCPAE